VSERNGVQRRNVSADRAARGCGLLDLVLAGVAGRRAGTLEAHEMVFAYPKPFAFRGFDAQGLDTIGLLSLDLGVEGTAPIVVKMKALSREKAFIDVDDDGVYTVGLDPVLKRRASDSNAFALVLPAGGDGDKGTRALPRASRATFTLFPGLLANPLAPGAYRVSVAIGSVDPDTGDSDDGDGSPPESRTFEQTLDIVPLGVQIDVKPGTPRNRINVKSHALVRVAILTTDGFDANGVDAASVEFGPGKARQARAFGRLADVDADGDPDLVLHFDTRETGIACGDTWVTLTGTASSGRVFEGTDAIRTVGCERKPPKPSRPPHKEKR
jgi:hypothetical protein